MLLLLSVASTGDGVASAAGNLLRPVVITFVGFGVARLSQPVSPCAALLATLPAVGLQGDLNPPVAVGGGGLGGGSTTVSSDADFVLTCCCAGAGGGGGGGGW